MSARLRRSMLAACLCALTVAALIAVGSVAQGEASRPARPAAVSCDRVRTALAAKKLVLLSFVSVAFARGCKDDETCGDWAEYLGAWKKAHEASAEVMIVPPSSRRELLALSGALPPFATVLIVPDGQAAVYRGVLVEPQAYGYLERLVRKETIDPQWADQVGALASGVLRCR